MKDYEPTRFMGQNSYYDQLSADIAVGFINCLKHPGGQWVGQPFELMPWQEHIIRDIFGVKKENGCRQFRFSYTEIPKKQGKSELAAAVALLLTCADREPRAEVYSCASDRQQASIVFDIACDMVDQCRELRRFIKPVMSQKRLYYKPLNSFYQVLSAEAYTKHGLNVHGVIFDELHALPDRRFFDVMTKGSGMARTQPLYFVITTAGTDKHSIGWNQHQKALDVLEGRRVDPSFYPVIYAAKDGDDWTDEAVWRRVNPSLGVTCEMDDLRMAFESAKMDVTEENLFKQLNLNMWVNNAVRWMPSMEWKKCAFPVNPERLAGRKCYGGLDLSATNDITAFVLVFPPDDPSDEDDKYQVLPFFWIPEDQMATRIKRDHVPYAEWKQRGFLQTTPGNVIHYSFIEQFITETGKKYDIQEIAFDRWGAAMLVQNLEGAGFTVVPFGQGYKDMSPASKELMRLVLAGRLAHGDHPVLEWMVGNVYVENDAAGNIKPNKEKSTEKIDGAVATIMALDRAIKHEDHLGAYDKHGLLIIDPSHPQGWYYAD